MQNIVIVFPSLPPNPNQTKRNHWGKNYEISQEWKTTAFYLAKQAYKGVPLSRAHLHYHVSVGDRRVHDADNIIASIKPLQDGLKGVVIEDDSIDAIEVSYSFDRASPRQIRLEIRALPS